MASRTCWYCSNDAHMTRLSDPYRPRTLDNPNQWLVAAKCDACFRPNLADIEVAPTSIGRSDQYQMPHARQIFDALDHKDMIRIDWQPKNIVVKAVIDVPEGIGEAAGEAVAALAIGAYKAAVLMCRAVIEATAKDHDVKTGTLAAKITELEAKRVITPSIADAAHEVRHLGNDMAHGDFATTTVSEAEASEVVEITEAILAEVYQRPARIARMKQRRFDK